MTSFDLPDVSHFVAGTEGPLGQRVFFLQAVATTEIYSWRLEKQQVSALSQAIKNILENHDLGDQTVPLSMEPFTHPAVPEWVVGTVGVGYNERNGRIVIALEEFSTEQPGDGLLGADETPAASSAAWIQLSAQQARQFADGANELVNAGRPICYLCEFPMEPEGHQCPRLN